MPYATNMIVIPAKAGIQFLADRRSWIPAFAGMTRLLPLPNPEIPNPARHRNERRHALW